MSVVFETAIFIIPVALVRGNILQIYKIGIIFQTLLRIIRYADQQNT